MNGPVRVRIDELVLDGVHGDAAGIGAAVEAALAQRLAGRELASASTGPVRRPIEVDGGAPLAVLAEAIADGIERGLR